MIKNIKNKHIPVSMIIDTALGPKVVPGTAIITNDEKGKTLSLYYGTRMVTIAFEQVEKYLR